MAEFSAFVRRPFEVKAVQITEENIAQLAPMVGELRKQGGEKFIALDPRVIPNIKKATIGYYITKMEGNLRCYSPKIFKEQFMEMPEEFPMTFTREQLQNEEESEPVQIETGAFGRIQS